MERIHLADVIENAVDAPSDSKGALRLAAHPDADLAVPARIEQIVPGLRSVSLFYKRGIVDDDVDHRRNDHAIRRRGEFLAQSVSVPVDCLDQLSFLQWNEDRGAGGGDIGRARIALALLHDTATNGVAAGVANMFELNAGKTLAEGSQDLVGLVVRRALIPDDVATLGRVGGKSFQGVVDLSGLRRVNAASRTRNA